MPINRRASQHPACLIHFASVVASPSPSTPTRAIPTSRPCPRTDVADQQRAWVAADAAVAREEGRDEVVRSAGACARVDAAYATAGTRGAAARGDRRGERADRPRGCTAVADRGKPSDLSLADDGAGRGAGDLDPLRGRARRCDEVLVGAPARVVPVPDAASGQARRPSARPASRRRARRSCVARWCKPRGRSCGRGRTIGDDLGDEDRSAARNIHRGRGAREESRRDPVRDVARRGSVSPGANGQLDGADDVVERHTDPGQGCPKVVTAMPTFRRTDSVGYDLALTNAAPPMDPLLRRRARIVEYDSPIPSTLGSRASGGSRRRSQQRSRRTAEICA